MKTCLIQLIGLIVVQGRMGVRMMGNQGMDRDLWRNAQRKEDQEQAG